jgi:hypothetical protein
MGDNERMRTPDASAVVVALSTLVAITTVSVVMSQLTPADRAGASLPLVPITTTAEPLDTLETLDIGSDEPAPTSGSSSNDSTTTDSAGDPVTPVVIPTPAEPEPDPAPEPEPEPEPDPVPPAPPAQPGNSANAPGHGGANPGQSAESGKP